jgi:hypothetical protein
MADGTLRPELEQWLRSLDPDDWSPLRGSFPPQTATGSVGSTGRPREPSPEAQAVAWQG